MTESGAILDRRETLRGDMSLHKVSNLKSTREHMFFSFVQGSSLVDAHGAESRVTILTLYRYWLYTEFESASGCCCRS